MARAALRQLAALCALSLLGAIGLAVPQATPAILAQPFVPRSPIGAPIARGFGLILTALGLGTAITARITLAGNWSAAVEDHALVRSGPYQYARHPIYSGILLAVLGSAIALNHWRALLGFALSFASLLLKSRHEETRLRQSLPDDEAYASETTALIPFLL